MSIKRILILIALLLPLHGAFAFTAGPNAPTVASDDDTVGTLIWENPNNALLENGSYSIATSTTLDLFYSHYLKVQDFNFNIPTSATINGIKVEVKGWGDNSDVDDNSVRIVKGNGDIGSQEMARADETWWPSSNGYWSYGSTTELWGETWTADDINSSDFGFAISVNNTGGSGTVYAKVDYIKITVDYSPVVSASFNSSVQLKGNVEIK